MEKQKYALIVAGGSGKRMETDIPKQFIEVAGLPILMHAIKAFYSTDPNIKFVIVLPEHQHKYWKQLIEKHNFSINHIVANGGSERFFSVKNGLEYISENSLVAVHDGVRPLVSATTINNCYALAEKNGSSLPVVPATESIRVVHNGESKAVDRSKYFMVQTPQIFTAEIILKAYEQAFSPLFTDDASVVEQLGNKIHLVDGNPENIKITRPMDLKIAEALFEIDC